jgi:hypothetical protein
MAFWPRNIAVEKDLQKIILNNIENVFSFQRQTFPTLFSLAKSPKSPKSPNFCDCSGNKPSSFDGFCLVRGAERRGIGSTVVNNDRGRRKKKKKDA